MSSSKWFSIFIILLAHDTFLDSSICNPVAALLTNPHPYHRACRILKTRFSQLSEDIESSSCFPNAIPVTEEDRLTIQRQTGQIGPSVAAIGVPSKCQCQHGYPQVFLLNPLVGEKRMNSGLLKLTCPLLVNAIDQMEDDGYIANFTEQVESSEEWTASCQTRHEIHANARKEIVMRTKSSSDDPMSILEQKLGEKGAEAFLNSGIAGATVEKPDVKCLHAWLGDYLFHVSSSSDNTDKHYLGEAIAAVLQDREVPLSGNADCQQYCNLQASGAPPKPRNKQRLKTQKEKDRRKRKREREQN